MSAEDDVMRGILGELMEPSAPAIITPSKTRLVTPKQPVVVLPQRPGVIGAQRVRAVPSQRLIVDDEGVGLGQIEDIMPETQYEGEIEKYILDKDEAGRQTRGDDFRTFSQMKKNEHKELNAAAPFTRSNPVSILEGILGNAVLVPAPRTSEEIKLFEVINWQGKDAETTNCTITLGQAAIASLVPVSRNGFALRPGSIRAYAHVQWGTSGALLEAYIDIGLGTQFTIGASNVRVQVARYKDGQSTNSQQAAPANLTGMLSFRVVERRTSLTYSAYLDATPNYDGATAASIVSCPPFAKSVSYWRDRTPTTLYPFRLYFLNVGGAQLYTATVAADVLQTTPIPLTPEVAQVGVENTTPDFNTGTLIFDLSL